MSTYEWREFRASRLGSVEPDSNDRHGPAGWAFFAMGEEQISSAAGAVIGDLNIAGGNASDSKLVASHGQQVEMHRRLARYRACAARSARGGGAGRLGGDQGQEGLRSGRLDLAAGRGFAEVAVTLREPAAERIDHLFAHLVAAGPDGGPDRRQDIAGLRAKDAAHLAHGLFYDPLGGTAPAGVDRGHGSEPRIDHQNGHAIGHANGKQHARFMRKEGVTGATIPAGSAGGPAPGLRRLGESAAGVARPAAVMLKSRRDARAPRLSTGRDVFELVLCCPHLESVGGVDLVEGGKDKRFGAQRLEETNPIALYSGGRV